MNIYSLNQMPYQIIYIKLLEVFLRESLQQLIMQVYLLDTLTNRMYLQLLQLNGTSHGRMMY